MSSGIAIDSFHPEDRAPWEELFTAYNTFYERTLAPERFDILWAALMDDTRIHGRAARLDGRLVGFTHFLPHASTSAPDVCYLQDLFTAPEARGHGVATRLIEAVRVWAADAGCDKVYWLTHESNAVARRLYDRVGVNRGFLQYQLPV